FIHSGDHIYADLVLPPEVKLANGEVWRNLVTEEKTHVAETLEDYRGNWEIQSARQEPARVQCRDPNALAMGRPRGPQQLVAGRAAHPRRASTPELSREDHAPPQRTRQPRHARISANDRGADRARPRLSQNIVRSTARCVHARHAQLPRSQRGRSGNLSP